MNTVEPKRFYSREVTARREAMEDRIKRKPGWVKEFRKMPANILGPTEFWKEFDKQADALYTAAKESNDFDALCTFAYQRDKGYRKFVVAHPERYWWYYKHRPPEKRCSYEIIPEHCPCRLYLDLEYLIEMNPSHDGSSMTNMVIEIFCAYLLARWSVPCNKYNVINLDSSTSEKFSRHLVFNVKHVAFKDNYHVGRLVKRVCQDILDYLAFEETSLDILNSFDRTELQRLIVETKNGKRLFIDTSVYTKNRQFRVYDSTKWGKRSNFTLSVDCKYIPSVEYKDEQLAIFLDSLVSYFVVRRDLVILEYSDCEDGAPNVKRFKPLPRRSVDREEDHSSSKYPLLNKHVRDLTQPGKVRSCKTLESRKLLVYETSGYRYCENVGRCHQSNNVYWVVDLKAKRLYQKCHDQDCAGFKSEPKRLPEEVCFEIDEDGDSLLDSISLSQDLS
ncbi:DNA-directed primase/polymerase protein-like [Ceratina calcarata]|uniref:DNA-directed primase/polymerase protein n=1 Tax=Ceratina calcarata TaxID=156304 RepID=A0AAJ7JD79_9HYME|nr:DNA-directed primase/polymerase protein-like [Ceratina calcarata]